MTNIYQLGKSCDTFPELVFVNFIPSDGNIEPHCQTFFDIAVSADVYGIYEDVVTIDVDYLPELKFRILIINEDFPLFYPICRNTVNVIPKMK